VHFCACRGLIFLVVSNVKSLGFAMWNKEKKEEQHETTQQSLQII